MTCLGCGERDDRCRCDGPVSTVDGDPVFGFHVWAPGDEDNAMGALSEYLDDDFPEWDDYPGGGGRET